MSHDAVRRYRRTYDYDQDKFLPRQPRLHVPGGLYHVTLRGNDRQEIFFDTEDRQRWESLLAEGLDRYGHRIHAYCWMTNHVHMAVQCHNLPLGDLMRDIASRYARSTNKKLGRTGHLFERRHHSTLVQMNSYLKELVRYIHLNPLRSGLVETINDYPWSSHAAYLHGDPPDWLTVNFALSAFGESPIRARREYARFLAVNCPPSVLRKFRQGSEDEQRVLGDDEFVASLNLDATPRSPRSTLEELTETICQKYGVSVADLRSRSRQRVFAAIRSEIGLAAIDADVSTNAAIARYFNRNQSGMSRAINRLRRQQRK